MEIICVRKCFLCSSVSPFQRERMYYPCKGCKSNDGVQDR